jgi:ribosomal protein S18 acetylase RimI-like enzyme
MKDYDEVVSVWKQSGLRKTLGDNRDEIRMKIRRDPELFLVAEDSDGKIIGTLLGGWDGRRGWIHHLGVIPSQQRSGVATKLVKEVERRMKRKGVVKVNALVYESNNRSLKFFEKMGYEMDRALLKHGKEL